MPTVIIDGVPATLPEGTSLSRIPGNRIPQPCGGNGKCGKCRIIAKGQLSPVTDDEKRMLSNSDIRRGIRLACRTMVTGNCEVTHLQTGVLGQICVSGISVWDGTAPMFKKLGVAVDIGTTTVAAGLFDCSGEIASGAAPNPQSAFGADVISRIGAAASGSADELAAMIRNAVNRIITDMCCRRGRDPTDIDGVVITGNTAMLHLLTGTPTAPLCSAPFEVKELFGKFIPPDNLGLTCAADATVYLPRCISAFVGADITTAAIAAGINNSGSTVMLADIGTNGEMILRHDGKNVCCSTAVGPAFEGTGISYGTQGIPGAIDRVTLSGEKLSIHTVNGLPAVGICGSGIVDTIACMLDSGIIDETGYLECDDPFELTPGISISQSDVRNVQLAKSAVCAGAVTLLDRYGLSPESLPRLYIAGGFGNYLDLKSAVRIGMIPEALADKSLAIGNAALSGAAMLLGNTALVPESQAFADSTETTDLSSDAGFSKRYIENMMF